jgi:hypothetical protein
MKTFLLSLFIVVTLLFTTNNASKAACPPGWFPMSTNITYNGCVITVNFCYFVSPMGMNKVILDSFTIPATGCPNGFAITDPSFWNFVDDEIILYLKPILNIPDCEDNVRVVITVERSACWKYVKTGGGFVPVVYSIVQCEETGTCEVRNEICYDQNYPPNYIRNNKTYSSTGGESTCETGSFWQSYPNSNPWDLPIFDICFHTCN